MDRRIFFRIVGLVWMGLVWSVEGWGQTTLIWRNEATNGNWDEANNWWNGSGTQSPPGGERLHFNNNNQVGMTNNATNTNRFQVTFLSGATTGRTIGGTANNTFFDYGGTWPRVENQSTALHSLGFPITIGTGGTWNMETMASTGPLQFTNTISHNSGKTMFVWGNNTAIDANNRYVRFSGVISGNGNLNISQFGTARIAAAHTYTGGTQIDNGELWIESGGSLTGTPNVGNAAEPGNVAKLWLSHPTGGTTFSNNITINQGNANTREIGGLNTSGTHTFSGNITHASNNGLIITSLNTGATLVIAGVISGINPKPVTYSGSGTIIVSGDNTYVGANTINAGTRVKLGGNIRALGGGTTTTTILAGGVLDLNGFTLFNAKPLNLSGTGIDGLGAVTNNPDVTSTSDYSGSLTLGGNATITSANGDINFTTTTIMGGTGFTLTLGGNFNGSLGSRIETGASGALTKEGTGTWTLTGASKYGGATTINGGILRIDGANDRLPTATALSIAAGATFDLNNLSQQVGSLTGAGAVTLGSGTLTVGGTATTTFSGNIIGTGGLTKTGTGTLTLSGSNTYSGVTTISQSDIIYNSANALPNGSNITIGGTATARMIMANTILASTFTPGTLTVSGTDNPEIVLGTSAYAVTITFANSTAAMWAAGRRLTIRNWSPSGNKNIFVTGAGLTTAQLDVIDFDGYGLGAKFDGTRLIPRFVYITQATGTGNFTAPASWINSDNPNGNTCAGNSATIVIQNGFTLNQDVDYEFIRIENNGTYTATANTITLCAGANFINNGTVNFSGTATVVCAAAATFSGGAPSANFGLNNLTINAATTLTTAPTIRGTLQLNTGSSVTAAPVYGNASTLVYNQGGTVNMALEWATGNALSIGAGLPQNVTIQNNTTLNFPNGANLNRGCAGNFTISSGGVLLGNNETNNDLYVAGNFTNNGTFTHNNRALFLVGGNAQTLNGTLNATGANNCFPFLLLNKTGGAVTLNNSVNVTNTLTLTAGNIILGAHSLNITSGNDIGGAPFNATKMIIADGTGQLLFTVTGNKTFLFPLGEQTGTTEYSPITITITENSGSAGRTIGMRVVDAVVPATPLNTPTPPDDYLTRYWLPSATGFTSIRWTGSFTYAATGDVVGNESSLRFSVWHPAPENAWMDYGGAPTGQTLSHTTNITDLGSLSSSAFITGRAVAPKLHYRSAATGNWNDLPTWQTSPDATFVSTSAALVPPSAMNSDGITIRNGHTVTVAADATLDQCVVQSGATLTKEATGNLVINDGVGDDDLDVYGTFIHQGGAVAVPVAPSLAGMRVRTNGRVWVKVNSTGTSSYGTSSRIWYEHQSELYWNPSASPAFASGGGTIYFQNSPPEVIPTFRINTINFAIVGGAGTLTFNGIFQIEQNNITWANDGTKVFRNGIIVNGPTTTLTQNLLSGPFQISGTTSVLGGSGSIALNTAGLQITAGTCTMLSNKSVNATEGEGTFTVNNGATLDAVTYSLSGTAPFTLAAGATLISANTAGVNGSITTTGTKSFTDGANYTFNGTANQPTGTLMGTTINIITINNPTTVTLTNDGHVASTLNLQQGIFRCGTGQTLFMPNDAVINGTGGNQDNNLASGTIHLRETATVNATLTGQPELYRVIIGNGVMNGGANFRGIGTSNATILNSLIINSQGFVTQAPFYAENSTLVYNSGGVYEKRVEMGQVNPGQPGYPWHVTVQNNTTLNLLPANVTTNQSMSGNLNLGLDGSGNGILNANNITNDIVVGSNLNIGGASASGSITLSSVFGADLFINGNYTRTSNGTFNPNNRAILFTGSTNAFINAPAPGPEPFPFVIVDKGGSPDNTLTLNQAVDISTDGKFTLSSGRVITTTDNILTIKNTTPDIGPGVGAVDLGSNLTDTSITNDNGYVDGPMRRLTVDTTAVNQRYLFPVGHYDNVTSTHYYKRMWIRSVDNSSVGGQYFTVWYVRDIPPGPGSWFFQQDLIGIWANEYWDVRRQDGSTARARLVLPYQTGEDWRFEDKSIQPIEANSNVAIVRGEPTDQIIFPGGYNWNYAGLPGNFTFLNDGNAPEARFFNNPGDVTSRLIDNFSPFTFGFGKNIILPLRLLSFTGALHGPDALLHWSIADAADLRHFEVEHSTNGQQFAPLDNVPPNGGTDFNFRHRQLPKGVHYYRLRMVEKDGRASFSGVVILMVDAQKTIITGLLQNPVVGGQARIGVFSERSQQAEAVVLDMSGRTLLRQKIGLQTGYNEPILSVLPLPAAMYKILLRTDDGVEKVMTMMK